MNKPAILVSACLLGVRCRYDGKSKAHANVVALADRFHLIPVCPEQLGGLTTPRPKAEQRDDRVVNEHGTDVTAQFTRGAEETVRIGHFLGVQTAILKEGSPSCGVHRIYDGSFTHTPRAGAGVTTMALRAAGMTVISEETLTL